MSKRILFQGDSITDCGRDRNQFYHMGRGYASMVTGVLGLDHPGEYEFINRGISGNRIVDLYARIKSDFINLQPDYASILIGVNETWHEVSHQNGVDTEKFEKISWQTRSRCIRRVQNQRRTYYYVGYHPDCRR